MKGKSGWTNSSSICMPIISICGGSVVNICRDFLSRSWREPISSGWTAANSAYPRMNSNGNWLPKPDCGSMLERCTAQRVKGSCVGISPAHVLHWQKDWSVLAVLYIVIILAINTIRNRYIYSCTYCLWEQCTTFLNILLKLCVLWNPSMFQSESLVEIEEEFRGEIHFQCYIAKSDFS